VAGRNLYAILGVPEHADQEAIKAAYASALAKLEAGGEAAAADRVAITESFKILSDGRLRGGYDRKLEAMRAPPPLPQPPAQSWSGVRAVVIVLALLAIPGYFYNEKRIERLAAEKAAELRRAEAKKQLEELEARRATMLKESEERNAERARQAEENRMYAQQQQDRARGAYNTMVVNRQIEMETRNAERERERQRRTEEMQRQREEQEARMRLENDKRRLRQLECSRGPC
jgi:curved DNA-binding protein CbpA